MNMTENANVTITDQKAVNSNMRTLMRPWKGSALRANG